ncbi:MAG: DinB family protein [Anaerolineae bacterium]|nr:DinB family protein [Anaerolineae bacterium]
MTHIKIQRSMDGPWVSVEWLHEEERFGWVKIREDDQEPEWVREDKVHSADQVVLRVERLARTRFEWVPQEDLAGSPLAERIGQKRTVGGLLADLRQSQRAFLDLLDQIIRDDAIYQRPAGAEWSIAVILAHINEARRYYAAEVQKVLDNPGTKMGRTVEHADRLQSINAGDQRSFDALREELIASHQQMVQTLSGMDNDDLQLEGDHVVAGPQPLLDFIERFMVSHDQTHVEQATALLAELQR